jgi:hypothetical protein
MKHVLEEKLTVWYMDEEGENKSKDIKEFIMDKFEELEPKTKKMISPLEKRLAAVDETGEERHIAMNTLMQKLETRCEKLESNLKKLEKEQVLDHQEVHTNQRESEEKFAELTYKLA